MPLLELGAEKSLSQRFGFLDVTGDVHDKPAEPVEPEGPRIKLIADPEPPEPVKKDVSGEIFQKKDMVSIGVIKSSIRGHKVFINLCRPVSFQTYYAELDVGLLVSPMDTSTDKSGAECYVLTVLDLKSRLKLDTPSNVSSILSSVRLQLGVDVSEKYTLPKMKTKGKLADVPLTPVGQNQRRAEALPVAKGITEIESISPAQGLQASTSGQRHAINSLSKAALAMPLPTRYTHHFSVPLLQRTSPSSWSVYFDSQDSTLKVLLPPDETFMTVAARTDDFRAFTKDGTLHIFYLGT